MSSLSPKARFSSKVLPAIWSFARATAVSIPPPCRCCLRRRIGARTRFEPVMPEFVDIRTAACRRKPAFGILFGYRPDPRCRPCVIRPIARRLRSLAVCFRKDAIVDAARGDAKRCRTSLLHSSSIGSGVLYNPPRAFITRDDLASG